MLNMIVVLWMAYKLHAPMWCFALIYVAFLFEIFSRGILKGAKSSKPNDDEEESNNPKLIQMPIYIAENVAIIWILLKIQAPLWYSIILFSTILLLVFICGKNLARSLWSKQDV